MLRSSPMQPEWTLGCQDEPTLADRSENGSATCASTFSSCTCRSSSRGRPALPTRLFSALSTSLLLLLLLPTANAQVTSAPASTTATPTATQAPSTTTFSPATATPVALSDSTIVRSLLALNSSSGAFFNFTIPASAYTYDNTVRTWVSLSLCDGPNIPAYNVSNAPMLEELGLTASSAQAATRVGLYASSDPESQRPGPDSPGVPNNWKAHAVGGWASLTLDVMQREEGFDQPVWLGVWNPTDKRNITEGVYELQLVVSTTAQLEAVDYTQLGRLDDTDSTKALFLSSSYTGKPNLTAIVLPTEGRYSLERVSHFNSSFCAISDAWTNLQRSNWSINVTRTETDRYTLYNNITNDRRSQFLIEGLQPGTNYTTFIVQTERINNDTSKGLTYTLAPSFKLRTKSNENCRLVHDTGFCRNVAYSIPIGPDVATDYALDYINRTVIWPSYRNFTSLLNTFPCGDAMFGQYSYVQDCNDCADSYLDWLCAITMPRCTDELEDPWTQSRASQDGIDLTGRPTGDNEDLLPYVVNRNETNSKRKYVHDVLRAGSYGELLPCIYNCYYVERTCPPIFGWTCPVWDVSAQRDYGTFADSGPKGIGAAMNGGAGRDGSRWGGPQRYVSIDGFGNAFCNALGVDIRLRESNAATTVALGPRGWSPSSAAATAALLAIVTSKLIDCL